MTIRGHESAVVRDPSARAQPATVASGPLVDRGSTRRTASRAAEGSAALAAADFEVCGPLPEGTTVLEASAGTGKTHAIVGLAVRYVAEFGIDIAQVLLVTFSRAATQELRERARDRFVAVAAALADPRAAAHDPDDVVRHLAAADPDEVWRRRSRLLVALSDFDAGTIVTTHSFCQRMLDELGLAGEHDPGVRLVDSVDELVRTVAEDVYLRRYARGTPPFDLRRAHALALDAVGDPHAVLVPEDDGPAGERVAFATEVRAETARRKRLEGLRDFDDLLTLLHGVLADPVHGRAACERIRSRYRVALVDEFQDTDPLQWDILRLAFHGHRALVLVGDPKQAIYAFRGAEVLSYLDAVARADTHRELVTNWRSDAGLLAALDHLHGGAALGHEAIVVSAVTATRPWSRLSGPERWCVPMRLRCLPRTGAGPLNNSGFPSVGRMRARAAADLAADIVGLLASGTALAEDAVTAPRPVGPGDIAVLVRTRSQLDVVREALDRVGVPSVLAGGSSVFATESATHWLWVLRALEQPHRSDRVRLAALTPLFGVTAAELDSGGADLVGRISAHLRECGRLFLRAGFAAVYEKLSVDWNPAGRLLAIENGERRLTDLRHLAQLLDQVALTEGFGPTALTRWLADRIHDPASGHVAERSRRLDKDAAAVQIATVHASKGLEFPFVYLPFAWDSAKNPEPATLLLHTEDGRRVLDVGGAEAPGYGERRARAEAEEAGEELRLLYVALTRAKSQVVAWWGPTFGTATAPLHRLIFGRPEGLRVPARASVPADAVAARTLTEWAASASAPSAVSVDLVETVDVPATGPTGTGSVDEDIAVARFDRVVDHQWRRTSYSALTAGAHEDRTAGAAPVDITDDEPDEPTSSADPAPGGAPSLMNAMPYGAEFGTLVHGVLEHIDRDAADPVAEVRRRCATAIEESLAAIDPDDLATALLAVLRTPLGFGCLADIPGRDQLSELEFELPLAGGDTPLEGAGTLHRIADLLRAHLDAEDMFHDYADRIDGLSDVALRGYLTGSIDAVLRVGGEHGPRFVVVDYKTNRLGTGDLTVAHYTRERMAEEMIGSHYPLQALLYSVALHRYLRWRLPGYEPARHLGGCAYLFVRGMIGPGTPEGAGVCRWNPPVPLIEALSDLLAGTGAVAEAGR